MRRSFQPLFALIMGLLLAAPAAHADIAPMPIPTPQPVEALGSVTLKAKPWAKVFRGDTALGTTPQKVSVAAGVHTFRFTKGSKTLTREVTVVAGAHVEVMVDMADAGPAKPDAPHTKGVLLKAAPWAKVTVDGTVMGTTPIRVDLKPGPHVAIFTKGDKTIEKTFEVVADTPLEVMVDFTK